MGFFFPPPGEAIDGHSRAGALTPVDRSCLRHITRVTADIRFTSGAAADIVWTTLDWTAARGGSCRRLQKLAGASFLAPLDFNCWCRLSYQLHLFSVKMFFMSAVFLSFQLFVNHPILFFSQFFLLLLLLLLSLSVHLSSICSHVSSVHSFIAPHCIIASFCKSTIYGQQSLSLHAHRRHSIRVNAKSRLSRFGCTLSLYGTRFI